MPDLLTGTLAFLFVDMEGSVKLWERYPEAMPSALVRYEAILRQIIEANDGHIFKTVGDACYASFRSASQAFAAGLAIHRALDAEDWGNLGRVRVRMSLHFGPAEQRTGDYFGLTLNRVDRLLRVGHGGQMLLSEAMREQVRDALPAGVELRDLGVHYLRDMMVPERIFQVVVPDLPAEFPPLRTLNARHTNLPTRLTSFVGRESEIALACDLLRCAEVRLLTLTGAGGTGKTRLGLQVASELLAEFEDGVFFVSLAAISTVGIVTSTIAQALGAKEASGQSLVESLKDYLQSTQMLLVLDNFEQVIAAAPLVTELLTAAPRIKVLVTSREVLHVYGEHELAVQPLPVPDLNRLPPTVDTASTLSHYAAIRLFVERAQAIRPDFCLTDENVLAVAEICARLDGLPLAIELAAAYCRMFSPQALLARLTGDHGLSSLQLLTGSARDLPARQQTLRGAIDWSYNLLDVGEKKLFARLAVFVGGCTLDAVEVICNTSSDLTTSVLEGMTSLLHKSMLQQAEEVNGEPRFAMLETIREYALERLAASGETALLQQYHAVYYLTIVERAEPELRAGPQQVKWLDRLEQEHGNLRAALEWSLTHGQGDIALRLSAALWRFWYWHSHLSEGGRWLETALAATHGNKRLASVRAKALNGAGNLASARGDYKHAMTFLEEGLALGRELGPAGKAHIAPLLGTLGTVLSNQGEYERARTFYEECLVLQREMDDRVGIALVLNNLGVVANYHGDYEQARIFLEESLERFRESGIEWGMAYALGNLGRVALCQGNYAQANALIEESHVLCQKMGDRDGIAECLARLGAVAAVQGETKRATALYQESLILYHSVSDKAGVAECLKELARLAGQQANAARAARLFGAAEALREVIRASILPDERQDYERSVAAARSQIDDTLFAAVWAAGRTMTLEQAIAYALKDERSTSR